jgi:hypothetical protein
VRRSARESLDRVYDNFASLRNAMAERAPEHEIRSAEAAMQVMAAVAVAEALVEIDGTLKDCIYPAIAELAGGEL